MTIQSFFRELYSLDTLDTRFTNSSSTPLKAVNEDTGRQGARDGKTQHPDHTSPSRWRTPEFYVHIAVCLYSIPMMYWAVVSVSLPDSPNYSRYEHLLSPGWLFGRKVDNSDAQYASFRNNLPYLAVVVVLHPLLRRFYERYTLPNQPFANGHVKSDTHGQAAADTRLQSRLAFDFVSALIYIVALNGTSIVKIVLILLINFKIATALPRHTVPLATWVFNIGILFANELGRGYRYSVMSEAFVPFFPAAGDWGKFLDSYGGLNPRWEVLFNLTVLRMISFNFDYYWSLDQSRAGSPLEKKQLDPSALSERDRVKVSAPPWTYTSFRMYVAYILYPPLYLTGPILTFNDYISQSTYPSPSVTTKRTTLYGIRFLITLFCMEFLIHTAYMVAISKASPDWSVYTPFQLSMLAYFNLHHIWLKLMIPWRFFRLWALIDGIDPPENMIRCMSDNYSTFAFWRSWHRSFNRWITRYVYVPLGGGPGGGSGRFRGILNMLAVFTFVALWHDIQLRLLLWGWMVVFFVLPEVLATWAFPASKWKRRPNTYRVICGIGGVANVLMMMSANLVGFAIGLDGLKSIIHGIVSTWQGALFLLAACLVLYTGVQVMFEHREGEKRRDIKLKC